MVPIFAQEEKPRLTQSSQDEPLCRPVSYGYSSKICDSVSLLFVEVMEMLAKSTDAGLKNEVAVRCSDRLHVCHVALCSALRIMKQTQLKAARRLESMERQFKEMTAIQWHPQPKQTECVIGDAWLRCS